MAIRLTRVHDRYVGEAQRDAELTWNAGGPLDPDEVLRELSKRGWDDHDIVEALKAADAKWAQEVGGKVESWGTLSMRSAVEDQPVNDVTPITAGWRFVSIGFERDPVDIGSGVNPWSQKWRSLHRRIVVAHPSYPRQRHLMDTYQIAGSDPPLVFAAGEFSNGVWGIYVPLRPPHDIRPR